MARKTPPRSLGGAIAVLPVVLCAALTGSLSGAASADSMLERAAVRDYLLEIAEERELDHDQLVDLFADLETNNEVLELIRRPAEKRLKWHEYRPIFLGQDRIRDGQAFLGEHAALFEQAAERYGVPPAVIAAIIGVETFYGRITGRFGVLDSLATLSFDHPPRAAFFRSELTEYLTLGTQENWALDEILGSYAGAMGLPQFISSSYRAYAVDFDEDGKTDLFTSIPDVIGSVANYLAEHGWEKGETVAEEWKSAPASMSTWVRDALKPAIDPAEIAAAGFGTEALARAIVSDSSVSVMQFDNGSGEDTLIGYKNFYVITRYNHSRLYARAVLELARALDPELGLELDLEMR
jgi:membrane-bound lytic murein transglycosylase B